jgi:SagB-type dehydrogenase family enzyme
MKNIMITILSIYLNAMPFQGHCESGASGKLIPLPGPDLTGTLTLEQALLHRRSIRNFSDKPLKIVEIAQLLWAGQGMTADGGGRTAPSAGAIYPLELYLAAGNITDLAHGVYHFNPSGFQIRMMSSENCMKKISEAAYSQDAIKSAPACIIIAGVCSRTRVKYGERAERYVFMEAGHVAQNILLQAVSLGLGAVVIGAFNDASLCTLLSIDSTYLPLYIIPIGNPA